MMKARQILVRQVSVIAPIIAANAVIFVLQLVMAGFTESFMLVSGDVLSRPWILFTSMFLHANFNHIFWNMYGLAIFGPLLEQRIGPKRFLFIYLFSGLMAAFFSSFFYPAALGASGAIMGMLGVLIILMPDLRLLFMFFIPMSLRTAGIIWILMDVFGIFVPSGVGNIAHLVGVACGLLYGIFLQRQKKRYQKRFETRVHLTDEDFKEYMRTGRI